MSCFSNQIIYCNGRVVEQMLCYLKFMELTQAQCEHWFEESSSSRCSRWDWHCEWPLTLTVIKLVPLQLNKVRIVQTTKPFPPVLLNSYTLILYTFSCCTSHSFLDSQTSWIKKKFFFKAIRFPQSRISK